MTMGDRDWQARHGRTLTREKWHYTLSAVGAQIGLWTRRFAAMGRHPEGLARLDLQRIVMPDSALAQAAETRLGELATPAVANHSHRSYIWASLLGQLDGKHWDAELLYVSMMLHDLGLTEAAHGHAPCAQCFTLDSVHAGHDVLAMTTPERAERIRRAIMLHLNIRVPGERHGWEAHYLQAGTSLDVVGQRFHELPPQLVRTTLSWLPRLNLKQELLAWLDIESALRPHSRFAMLKAMDMKGHVTQAPFAS